MIKQIGLFAIQVTLFQSVVCSQTIDWDKTTHWKLYDIHQKAALRFPVDTLPNFKSVPLRDINMQATLARATIWPKDKTALWMGFFIATYQLEDGEIRKLIISNYGGFVYDTFLKRYYEIPEEKRAEWYDYLNDVSATFYDDGHK